MSVSKSDMVATLTLVAKILRKSVQGDIGRWPVKLVLRIPTSLWKQSTVTSKAIIWVIAPSGFRNVMHSSHLSLHLLGLHFSEISDMPAGSGATDSQDAIRLFPVSQGPTYTLKQWWGPCVCVGESEYDHRNGDNPDCRGPGVPGPVAQQSSRIPDIENTLIAYSFFLTCFLMMTLGMGVEVEGGGAGRRGTLLENQLKGIRNFVTGKENHASKTFSSLRQKNDFF